MVTQNNILQIKKDNKNNLKFRMPGTDLKENSEAINSYNMKEYAKQVSLRYLFYFV